MRYVWSAKPASNSKSSGAYDHAGDRSSLFFRATLDCGVMKVPPPNSPEIHRCARWRHSLAPMIVRRCETRCRRSGKEALFLIPQANGISNTACLGRCTRPKIVDLKAQYLLTRVQSFRERGPSERVSVAIPPREVQRSDNKSRWACAFCGRPPPEREGADKSVAEGERLETNILYPPVMTSDRIARSPISHLVLHELLAL